MAPLLVVLTLRYEEALAPIISCFNPRYKAALAPLLVVLTLDMRRHWRHY